MWSLSLNTLHPHPGADTAITIIGVNIHKRSMHCTKALMAEVLPEGSAIHPIHYLLPAPQMFIALTQVQASCSLWLIKGVLEACSSHWVVWMDSGTLSSRRALMPCTDLLLCICTYDSLLPGYPLGGHTEYLVIVPAWFCPLVAQSQSAAVNGDYTLDRWWRSSTQSTKGFLFTNRAM